MLNHGTDLSSDDIDRVQIRACIERQSLRLDFPARLEARFFREMGPQRCLSLIRMGWVGLIASHLMLLPKWLLLPDVFALTLKLQLLVIDPVLLLSLPFLRRNPPVLLRELSVLLFPLVETLCLIITTLDSNSPLRWVMPQFCALSFLYLTTLQRLRFVYVLFACLLIVPQAVYLMWHLPAFAGTVFNVGLATWLAAVVLALIGSYNSEKHRRLIWLLSQLSQLQTHELDHLSRHDPLTGLGNRRFLKNMLSVAPAAGSPLAVIMLDIDHFKKLNDSAGHQAGDHCLVQVAGVVRGELRTAGGHAFRYGGEEFLILLRNASEAVAVEIAERIRVALEALNIPHPGLGTQGRVTVSLGVASCAGEQGVGALQLVPAADGALYAAKQAGRNRVFRSGWSREGVLEALPLT